MASIPLYRDRLSATGVTAAPGPGRTPIAAVAELPEHRTEVHVFQRHADAVIFVEGLEAALRFAMRGGNQVVWHRAPDCREGALVVLAYPTEERPAGDTLEAAVPVVHHRISSEESRLIARHLDETIAGRERQHQERVARVRPMLDALAAAGLEASYDGNTGPTVRVNTGGKNGHDSDAWCDVTPNAAGKWLIQDSLYDSSQALMDKPLDPRIAALLEEGGLTLDAEDLVFGYPPVTIDEALPLIRALGATWNRLRALDFTIRCERVAAREAATKAKQRARAAAKRRERAQRA